MSGKKARLRRQAEREARGGLTEQEWRREKQDARTRLEQAASTRFDEMKRITEKISPRLAKRMRRPTSGGLVEQVHPTNRRKARDRSKRRQRNQVEE